jgi:hypothetical protein
MKETVHTPCMKAGPTTTTLYLSHDEYLPTSDILLQPLLPTYVPDLLTDYTTSYDLMTYKPWTRI